LALRYVYRKKTLPDARLDFWRPAKNVFSIRNSFLGYGITGSLALVVMAFSWTKRQPTLDTTGLSLVMDDEITVNIPITGTPPPPPPPPVVQEVPNDVSLNQTAFLSQAFSRMKQSARRNCLSKSLNRL
jgi:hypothetical protein